MGSGKVEIQTQDSHFPTAPIACGARKKPGRLHKTLDAPQCEVRVEHYIDPKHNPGSTDFWRWSWTSFRLALFPLLFGPVIMSVAPCSIDTVDPSLNVRSLALIGNASAHEAWGEDVEPEPRRFR